MVRIRVLALSAAIMLAATAGPRAYVFLSSNARWPTGSIQMHLQLGSTGSLMDGTPSWGVSAENALADWNRHLLSRAFRAVHDSTVEIADGDLVNSVYFSDTVYDRPFEDAVAIAVTRVQRGVRVEGDVIFNTAYDWNSYRGDLRSAPGGGTLYDIKRVALHEFGHVLGLGHPDTAGQRVRAVMNSRVSDTDRLQNDDIDGVRALYGGGPLPRAPRGPVVINFPPRNESLEFRNALEERYRDTLRRAPSSSFVDVEGTVVWTQEYLRYRVNRCPHEDAVNRVMLQIEGAGIQPVCGPATSANFPPRNEPFDFRNRLEAKYRDDLRRASTQTYVDVEGDIVWTQEYLRYRVSRCTHDEARGRVFQQIDGGGVLAGCS